MTSETVKLLLGLGVVVVGLFVFLVGFGYPVTTCFGVVGGEMSCQTDQSAVVVAYGLMAVGFLGVGAGTRTAWTNW